MSRLLCYRKRQFLTLLLSILLCANVSFAKKKSRKNKYIQEDTSTTTDSNQGQYPFYGYANDNSHVGFSYVNHYNGNTDKGQVPTSLEVGDGANNGFQGIQSSMPIYDSKYEPNTNAETEIVFDSRRGHKQYEEDPYSSLHRPSKALSPLYSYDAANPKPDSNPIIDYHSKYYTGSAYGDYTKPTAPAQESSDHKKSISEVNIFPARDASPVTGQSYGKKLNKYKKKSKNVDAPMEEHDSKKPPQSVDWNYFSQNPDPNEYVGGHKNFVPQQVTSFNAKSKFKDVSSLPEHNEPQYSESNADFDSSKWNKKPFQGIQYENSPSKLKNRPHLKSQTEDSFIEWNQKPYSEMNAENFPKFQNTKPYLELQAEESIPKRKKKPYADMNFEDSFSKWSQQPSTGTKTEESFPKLNKYAPLSLEHIKFDEPEIEHISYEHPKIKPVKLEESKLVHSKIPETFDPIPMAMSHYNFATESPDFKSYASAFSNYDDAMADSIQAGSGYETRQRTPSHSPPAFHYPVQKPMTVEIPQTILIPVPQPYPIRVPVPRPVAVPVVRELRVPVEKEVPYPVYKNVPYAVEKPIPVPIEKQVAIPVAHPYPVPIPHVRPVFHHSRRPRDQTDSISDYREDDEDEEWEDFEGTGVASLRKRVNSRLRPRRPKLRRARRSRRGNLRRNRRRGPPRLSKFQPMYPMKTPSRDPDWKKEKDASRFDQMAAGSLGVFDWRQEQDLNVHDHFLDHHSDPEQFIEDHARYHRELDGGRNYMSDHDYYCHRGRN